MDYPIILTPAGKYEAILNHAYNIIVDDELLSTAGGHETLTFLLSNYDRKRRLLANERILEVQGRRYIVRVIEDLKNNSNVCTVSCDALWYDLNDGELKHLMHLSEDDYSGNFRYLGKRNLSTDSRGDDVRELQKYLNSVGHSCGKIDGIFGPDTESGVKSFEKYVGMETDGIVDDAFVQKLRIVVFGEEVKLSALQAVSQQLEGTDWTIGVVDVEGSRDKHTSDAAETSLYNLRQISGIYGGDLKFDTVNQTVSLLANMGIKHQKVFCYERNATSIKRTTDTRNLFTRYTLIGMDADGKDVTVADINGGKDYVENYDWFDWSGLPRKIKWYRQKDQRWSDKQNMLDHMHSWLKVYSQPIVGYELDVSLFEISPNLGDYVFVYDKDLNIGNWLRVVSRKKNVLQPHLSTVVLEATRKTIVETIVSNTMDSELVQEVKNELTTPNGELRLPPGTEGWVMQYVGGAWKATDVVGNINSILDHINGEVL